MADDLKQSFKRDWQRWSVAERTGAVALLVAVTALISPFTLALF
jgi:hypothetical protein